MSLSFVIHLIYLFSYHISLCYREPNAGRSLWINPLTMYWLQYIPKNGLFSRSCFKAWPRTIGVGKILDRTERDAPLNFCGLVIGLFSSLANMPAVQTEFGHIRQKVFTIDMSVATSCPDLRCTFVEHDTMTLNDINWCWQIFGRKERISSLADILEVRTSSQFGHIRQKVFLIDASSF